MQQQQKNETIQNKETQKSSGSVHIDKPGTAMISCMSIQS